MKIINTLKKKAIRTLNRYCFVDWHTDDCGNCICNLCKECPVTKVYDKLMQ